MVELKVDKELEAMLPSLHTNDPGITSAAFGGYGLSAIDAKNLAEAVEVNTKRVSLNLGDNDSGAGGCAVTVVCLSGNKIGDEGCAALAEAHKVTDTVEVLNLNHNGCEAHAKALKSMRSQRWL